MKTPPISPVAPYVSTQANNILKTPDSAVSAYRHVSEQVNSTNLSFTTKDGDKVSIHLNSESKLDISANNAKTSILENINLKNNNFSMNVQGDLSQSELSDLASLIADLNEISQDFFNGNLNDAISGAMNIGNMGSIVELEANFTRSSIFSESIIASHPVPTGIENFRNEFNNDKIKPVTPENSDFNLAQWKQLLDYLNEKHTDAMLSEYNYENSESSHSEEMFKMAKDFFAKNPRLTPLLPSIADLAVHNAFQPYEDSAIAKNLKDSLSEDLSNKFKNWLIG